MPKVSRHSASVEDHGPVEQRHEEVEGYDISFLTFRVDIDAAPLLRGLPGDRCPCPHWGYVTKGRVTFGFEDREEVFEAGDAFFVPGGHLQRADAGTEYLQFSPSDELKPVSDVMERNMRAMQRA
jgi:hypothetical protein